MKASGDGTNSEPDPEADSPDAISTDMANNYYCDPRIKHCDDGDTTCTLTTDSAAVRQSITVSIYVYIYYTCACFQNSLKHTTILVILDCMD